MQSNAAASVLLLLLSGCNASDIALANLRNKVHEQYSDVLSIALDAPVQLSAASADTDLTSITVRKTTVHIPRFLEIADRADDQTAVATYSRFRLLVNATAPDARLHAIPPEFGTTNFDRLRNIYSLTEADLRTARSTRDLANLTTGATLKGILLTDAARERLVEFKSATLQGFILGSIEKGSRGVQFECFPIDNADAPKTVLAFFDFASEVRDADIEQFMATVRVQP